jgi:transposase-like protein
MTQAQRDIQRKLRILEQAAQTENVSKTCRYYGISRTQFYEWKRNLIERGEAGLVNRKPCPQNIPFRTPAHIEEKIL